MKHSMKYTMVIGHMIYDPMLLLLTEMNYIVLNTENSVET